METLEKEKILFIQTAFIGDAILSLPAIQVIKVKYPGCIIDVLCIPSTAEIFAASPYVNSVHVIDKKRAQKHLKQFFKFAGSLKRNNYQKVFSPHRSFRTALIVLMTGVRETYGFSNSEFKYAFKYIIEYKPNDHEVQRNLSLVGFNFEEDWRILPEIIVSENQKEKIESFRNVHQLNSFIAIAPGSIWKTKRYPLDYYKEIIEYLTAKDYRIILIGGEADSEECNKLLINDKVISAVGKFSLIETVYLLYNAKLLISNDSAPGHLAMCSDIPNLMLYCSTIAGFGFYPYNRSSKWLSYDDLHCKPCGIHGYDECPLKHFECGMKLYPQKVIEEIVNMIQ